jgi:hypothetical protein
MWVADFPALTLAIRGQYERSFPRANQYSYFAHALCGVSVHNVALPKRDHFF